MIMRRILGWILVLGLLCSGGVLAQEKTQLAQAMGQIQSSFEALQRDIENDSLDQDNILAIYHLTQAAELAVTLDPPGAERMQGMKREQYVKGYRMALKAMIADAEKLSEMVKSREPAEDRYDQLMKVYSHQKKGHSTFQGR